jgi:O-antigen ligase
MTPYGQPAVTQEFSQPQQKGILLLAFYTFLLLGRVPEMLVARLGSSLHITMIMILILSITCLFSGGSRGLSSKPGVLLILFTSWMVIGIPFSVWKGGSVHVLTDYWIPSLLIFFTTAGLLNTVKDCWRICWAMCLAMLFLVTFGSLLFGASQVAGRFNFAVGTLANANLLGQHLLFGLPFCLLMTKRSGVFSLPGFVGLISSLLLLFMVIKTGSRASMIAFLVMGMVLFLEANLENKMKLVVLYMALFVGGLAFAPSGALERYRLMFSTDDSTMNEDQVVDSAKASSEARLRHLQQSIEITKTNPLFGVGAGMFTVGAADYAKAHGLRADWLETHNTFTQLSSETGLPGTFFYLLMLISSLKSLFAILKKLKTLPELRELTNIAVALRLSFVGTITTALFANLGYQYYFHLLAGLTVAFVAIAENAIRNLNQATLPAVPVAPKLIYGRSNRPKNILAY